MLLSKPLLCQFVINPWAQRFTTYLRNMSIPKWNVEHLQGCWICWMRIPCGGRSLQTKTLGIKACDEEIKHWWPITHRATKQTMNAPCFFSYDEIRIWSSLYTFSTLQHRLGTRKVPTRSRWRKMALVNWTPDVFFDLKSSTRRFFGSRTNTTLGAQKPEVETKSIKNQAKIRDVDGRSLNIPYINKVSYLSSDLLPKKNLKHIHPMFK